MRRAITAESYAEYMAGKTYLYQTANALDLESAGAPVEDFVEAQVHVSEANG